MDRQLSSSKVCQIITVMKTKRLVFPEELYLKNGSFWLFNSCFVLIRGQQKHQYLGFHCWDYLTNFWHNNWQSIIDVLERLCLSYEKKTKKQSKTYQIFCQLARRQEISIFQFSSCTAAKVHLIKLYGGLFLWKPIWD